MRAIFLLALLFSFGAQAQYPSKPVRVFVGYAAGSSTDVVGRVMAERLGAYREQHVYVETRAGAAGNLAADAAAHSAGDGYTLLFAQNGVAISAAALPNLPYRAEVDLVPLAPVASTPHILIVAPDFPAKSVQELIARARRAGQARLRVIGSRQLRSPVRRALQSDGGHPGRACALQGRRAGGHRSHGGSHRLLFRRHASRTAALQVGPGAGARRDEQAALFECARGADDRRAGPARLRGDAVAGILRAGERRARARRAHRGRHPARARTAGDAPEAPGRGREPVRGQPGQLQALLPRRDREVARGGEEGKPEAGMRSQGSSWPRTSPPLCWLVWTFTYVLPALNACSCAAVNLAPAAAV